MITTKIILLQVEKKTCDGLDIRIHTPMILNNIRAFVPENRQSVNKNNNQSVNTMMKKNNVYTKIIQ